MNTAIRNPSIINTERVKVYLLSSKGKANIELYVTIHLLFDDIANEGSLFATRLVQEETGLTARDDDTDDVVLPPYMRKHR